MRRVYIYVMSFILLLVGCDYNDTHFEGYDDVEISDVVQYEGAFDGEYPEGGFFTDKVTLEMEVNRMLKEIFLYCDKGSTAKVSVLYGDITPGFSAADKKYKLTVEDYKSMGTNLGEPGKFNNFDKNMDIDSYLIAFCEETFNSFSDGKIVSISYDFYTTGEGVSVKTSSYKKTGSSWLPIELEAFTTHITYTLDLADYASMGTAQGEPGKYNNFDANMDIDMYIGVFLGLTYPYTSAGKTAEVSYLYYENRETTERSRIYKFDGNSWLPFDPYAATVEVTTKLAEMFFDGDNWLLNRLLGGTYKYKLGGVDYLTLLDWVKINKPEYLNAQNNNEEFYFGSAPQYLNINNNYGTWREQYNIGGAYTGLSNEQLQEIMDARIAEGIADVILPSMFSDPDSGLSYTISYTVYQGRGTGNYVMSFMYEEEKGFEWVGGPIKE